ncbi:MAG: S1C family serine protease [Gaiellaceae bacterium]
MSYDEYEGRGRTLSLPALAAGLAIVAALGVSLFAVATVREQNMTVELLRTDVRELEGRLEEFRVADQELSGRLKTSEGKLRRKDQGIAPLANRVLKSVFTVNTSDGLGAGFAGWREDGQLFVVTAAHVVSEVGEQVLLERNTGSWRAEVVARDRAKDLAVLRVDGNPVGARPLWQKPAANKPRVGDELVLVGSPFGLGGTVTSGVVSRVRPKVIQTDAAANPGNSGGPAVDRKGRVVGVLVAGGGENINFAVPILRLCGSLRDC